MALKKNAEYDAIVVGAGFGGIRTLWELSGFGLSVKCFEAGADVGGAWFWNKYPGARTDSEAWVYAMNFAPELRDAWNYTERYPSQAEVQQYLSHVVDLFGLRKHISFETPIRSAHAAYLVPETPPFAFGTKRSSLEQDYYECLDRDNVDIVDLKANKIREFTEEGIIGDDGLERQFDTVVMATGFDAMTGSLTNMNIHGKDGLTFKDRWKDGVFTHLGLCVSGCPNIFLIYGPQAPTAFTNAPMFIESQVDIVIDLLTKLQREGIKSIEAKRSAELRWKQGHPRR